VVVHLSERRTSPRIKFRTDLRLRVWKAGLAQGRAQSIDLSESGTLLATETAIPIGSSVELLLKMPEQVTGKPTTEWRCTGHVVRAQSVDLPPGKMAFGVEFDYYEILRSKNNGHT
jgi:hypothetical protein